MGEKFSGRFYGVGKRSWRDSDVQVRRLPGRGSVTVSTKQVLNP